jgi:hypothetical protein
MERVCTENLEKAVAGEFYPDKDVDHVEGEDEIYAWHIEYKSSSLPQKHRVLVKEVKKNKDENSREVCTGFITINGNREYITVVKFPN